MRLLNIYLLNYLRLFFIAFLTPSARSMDYATTLSVCVCRPLPVK